MFPTQERNVLHKSCVLQDPDMLDPRGAKERDCSVPEYWWQIHEISGTLTVLPQQQ